MSFDGLVMSAERCELSNIICGGRMEKIYQPTSREVTLLIHKGREKFRLLLSADARDARVHLTQTVKENPLTPPLFCMVLRKHLEGGRILDVLQSGLERVLTIKVEAVDELGMLAEKHLICEVMGKHSNIILVDPATGIILDGINRYSYATSRHREILPGRRYTAPPESGKLDPLSTIEEDFRLAVWDPDIDLPIEKVILHKFAGFGPQTCREITVRAGLVPGTSSQALGELDLQRLWQSFSGITGCISTGAYTPSICYSGNRPQAFSAIELTQFADSCCRRDGMNEVLEEFFSTREKQERFQQAAAELMKTVKHEIKKVQKKIGIHTDTIRQAGNAEQLKVCGELITANIYQIPPRVSAARLLNYYDPEGNEVTVELDPQLTAAENAQSYFKRYTKARNSQSVAETYLAQAKDELAYLESVMLSLEQAGDPADLIEIKAELIKEGYLKQVVDNRKNRKPDSSPEPAPICIDIEGYQILIGRNNRQNDYLTLKLAQPEDLWLHVKDVPGSHVIVKCQGKTGVPDSVMQKAAEAAAYFSKARLSSKVPVDYTLCKHVRKPKGAKPGMVIYDKQHTVFVKPKNP